MQSSDCSQIQVSERSFILLKTKRLSLMLMGEKRLLMLMGEKRLNNFSCTSQDIHNIKILKAKNLKLKKMGMSSYDVPSTFWLHRIPRKLEGRNWLTWKMPVTVIYVTMEIHQDRYFDISCYACVILCQNNKEEGHQQCQILHYQLWVGSLPTVSSARRTK